MEQQFREGAKFLAALWLQAAAGDGNSLCGLADSPAKSLWESVRLRAGEKSPKWLPALFGRQHAEIVPAILRPEGGTTSMEYCVHLTPVWAGLQLELHYTAKAEAVIQPPALHAAAAKYLLQGSPEPKWETRPTDDRPDPSPVPPPTLPAFDALFPDGQWQDELKALVAALQCRGWQTSNGPLPLPSPLETDRMREEDVIYVLNPMEETSGLAKYYPHALARTHGQAHVVLVSPREWSTADLKAFREWPAPGKPRLHLLGQRELEALLRAQPHLLARYYPHEAARLHPEEKFSPPEAQNARASYLAKLSERLPEVNLVGFPRHKTQHVKHRFLPLGKIFEPPGFHPESAPLDDPGSATSLAALLTTAPCCVLLGDPGAGKTTLLHYAGCVWPGTETLAGARVAQRVPLLLPLREFAAARAEKTPPTLLEALIHRAQSYTGLSSVEAHPWVFMALLELGEAAVLLDGLDEAGDETERREITRLIQEFRARFPACPVWVTSRVVGYDDCRIASPVFQHLRVDPFTPEQRDSFIRKWYALQVGQVEPSAGSTAAPDSLIRTLESPQTHADVKHMAGNPLLLSLMALIHYTGGELPQKRGELYEQCVRTLVDQWERVKDPQKRHPVLERLNLSADRAEVYLAAVAFAAQKADAARGDDAAAAQGSIPEELARQCILPLRLADREDGSEKAALEEVDFFLRYVRERAGLLIWRGARTYAFVHRSFQEYLAAYQQAGNQDRSPLRQRNFFLYLVRKTVWRETLLLFLYHFNRGTSPRSFLDELVADVARRTLGAHARATWQALTLAVRDELRATPPTKRQVLKQAILGWAAEPAGEAEEVKALQDLVRFAPAQTPHLRAACEEIWQDAAVPDASKLASLHLRAAMLAWPHGEPAESERLARELLAKLPPAAEAVEARPLFERAGLLLADAGPQQFPAGSPGEAAVKLVRERLEALMFEPRLTIQERDASAQALGWLGDLRPGVGLDKGGLLPELEWLDLPGGKLELGEQPGKRVKVAPFQLSKYPVTVAQFQAFLDDPQGYHDPQWWQDAPDSPGMADWWRENHEQGSEIYEPVFQTPNHPRVGVCWYEAVAFCRWLTAHIRSRRRESALIPGDQRGLTSAATDELEIRLPHEAEWELAARWDGKKADARTYPWGECKEEDLSKRSNYGGTGLGHTSAVGLFPSGASKCGALDMAGNVWEWCGNRYDSGQEFRVLRGGAWHYVSDSLRAAYRYYVIPDIRGLIIGFRLVCAGVFVR
jgi:formylglycine-generating enzyme required for sulfatase activity